MGNITRENTCCFTGHRPNKLPWGYNEEDPGCLILKDALYDVLHMLYDAGYRHFLCGMAEGADMYFGEAVVALREERPGVTFGIVIPFEHQEKMWAEPEKRRYARLAEASDSYTVLHSEYAREYYLERDRLMVDRSSVLVAVYDGRPGGTQYTIRYAQSMGLEIVQLPPILPNS